MLSVIVMSLSGLIGAFMPEAVGFGIFRFLTGIGGIGTFMVTFVLAVEFVGPKYTMLIGIAIEIPFAIGELILGLEAYLIRDWVGKLIGMTTRNPPMLTPKPFYHQVTLQLVAYTPLIVFLFLWLVVPESPRWLLSMDRTEEAIKIIKKAAKINGRHVPDQVFIEGTGDKSRMDIQVSMEIRGDFEMHLFQPTGLT